MFKFTDIEWVSSSIPSGMGSNTLIRHTGRSGSKYHWGTYTQTRLRVMSGHINSVICKVFLEKRTARFRCDRLMEDLNCAEGCRSAPVRAGRACLLRAAGDVTVGIQSYAGHTHEANP